MILIVLPLCFCINQGYAYYVIFCFRVKLEPIDQMKAKKRLKETELRISSLTILTGRWIQHQGSLQVKNK